MRTPADREFTSANNGQTRGGEESDAWKITHRGEVNNKVELTLGELKRIQGGDAALGLDCGGQGRAAFSQPARGTVGNKWRSRLPGSGDRPCRCRSVKEAGLKPSAKSHRHYAADLIAGDAASQHLAAFVRLERRWIRTREPWGP